MSIQKVKAVTDYDGHWYLIPNDLVEEFFKDLDKFEGEDFEDYIDSGEFDNKYFHYRTGGDLNLVQLYADV